MRRREFVAGIGSAAVSPLVAGAQQSEPMRRIGVLLPAAADDAVYQIWVGAFLQRLGQLGWSIGRNVQIDTRWAGVDAVDIRRQAAELAALSPDAILAHGASAVRALLEVTRTVPIVFPTASDPAGVGLVGSQARPGGNVTGFMSYEYSVAGKWLELLRQIAPSVTRVAVLLDPANPTGIGQFGGIQAAASLLRVEVNPVNLRDAGEIERPVAAFAHASSGGLVVTSVAASQLHRHLIITLAARYKLAAVYWERFFVAAGGLISYGLDRTERYRQTAGYVDRILRGEKPADLPVQAPTRFETVINLKTAKSLGLTIPETLLATADEVIQ
jgi:putative tryptophan/tyrosine transport system substrate-binding protein